MPLGGIDAFAGLTAFDLLDQLTSNLLLPVGGLAIALFSGWALPRRLLTEELHLGPRAASALTVALRFVVPAGILAASLSWFFGYGAGRAGLPWQLPRGAFNVAPDSCRASCWPTPSLDGRQPGAGVDF